ncbi:MAG: extracellular solute-binding protein [Chloroflexi bacterium]|nr:extracellular solute-binding protein [Chloroflexota bacterium]
MLRTFWRTMVVTALLASVIVVQPAQAADTVTLKIMNWSQEQAEFYEDVADEFNDEYPNIELEFETMEQSAYREALPLMFQSDQAPDIFFWISTGNRVLTMAELYEFNWIAPLNPDGVSDDWLERFPAGSFVEGINMVDGEVYSFPFNDNQIWGPGYMYMNNDVIRMAGLDPDAPPATWDELHDWCNTIKDQTGVYCLAIPLQGNDFQRTWYPLAGSIMTDRFFDYQQGRFAIDDPRLLEAFEFIQQLYEDDLVVPGVEDKGFARQAMGNGLAAIYFGGAWMPSVFENMGFDSLDLGVAPPPRPDDGPVGALQQGYSENKYFVSSQTDHPAEAWAFIEWMTRPDGYFATEYLARGYGTLAFSDNAAYIENPVMQQLAADIAPTLRVLYPEPLVRCPDLAQSEAYLEAEQFHPNWEWEEMVEALVSGDDFSSMAAEIAETKNEIFLAALEEEAAAGLDVSIECYTYPDWEFTENFDPANY